MKNIVTSEKHPTFHFAIVNVADLHVVFKTSDPFHRSDLWRVHSIFFGQFANVMEIGSDGMSFADFRRKQKR